MKDIVLILHVAAVDSKMMGTIKHKYARHKGNSCEGKHFGETFNVQGHHISSHHAPSQSLKSHENYVQKYKKEI